ncbi:hypothetical protein RCS94_00675 [Orbaceae bacterium ac157xtp]
MGAITSTIAFTLTELAIGMPDLTHLIKDYNEYGLYWIVKKNFILSTTTTLAFAVVPASLLSCYYTNKAIQKYQSL